MVSLEKLRKDIEAMQGRLIRPPPRWPPVGGFALVLYNMAKEAGETIPAEVPEEGALVWGLEVLGRRAWAEEAEGEEEEASA